MFVSSFRDNILHELRTKIERERIKTHKGANVANITSPEFIFEKLLLLILEYRRIHEFWAIIYSITVAVIAAS